MKKWKEDNLIFLKEDVENNFLGTDGGLRNFNKIINTARKDLKKNGKTSFLGCKIEYEKDINNSWRKTGYVIVKGLYNEPSRYRGWESSHEDGYPLEDVFQDIVWNRINNIFKNDVKEDWEFED